MAKKPAQHIEWRSTPESSNVEAVGWDKENSMFVLFKNGGLYVYRDVPIQRVVAASRAESVGRYVNKEIIPKYPGIKIEAPVLTFV